jgi:hypothetical protein
MINRESRIVKLRKTRIYGNLYAIDKDNNDLYDYESALKGTPIKIGKITSNPTKINFFDESTGKTVNNGSTGKTTTQKGGTIYFDRTSNQWIVPNTVVDPLAIKYANDEKDALTKLGIGSTHIHGSTQSYNPNTKNWYIISNGPDQKYTLRNVIKQIYNTSPRDRALQLFDEIQSDIASATHGRERGQRYRRDGGDYGHRFYLNRLYDLDALLHVYTHTGTYQGEDLNQLAARYANPDPSSSSSDDESSSSKGLGKFERMSSKRNGGKRKSKKSRKSKKFRKSKKKMRKSKNKKR